MILEDYIQRSIQSLKITEKLIYTNSPIWDGLMTKAASQKAANAAMDVLRNSVRSLL